MQHLISEFIDMFWESLIYCVDTTLLPRLNEHFFQSTKETLPSDTVIILLDFVENYSFLVQDAVQGYH